MQAFMQKYRAVVSGVLNGWDRLMIRGTLRALACLPGMETFLWHVGVLLKNFGQFVETVSGRVQQASLAVAEGSGRPIMYLPSSQTRKEDIARQIAAKDRIEHGLVCVLRCVEPCQSYSVRGDRASKRLVLQPELRKCLHLYHYWMDADFGLMHARLMTWFPFNIYACLNGRLWLARQLDRLGLGYQRVDNCFTRLDDVAASQRVMDQLLDWDWPSFLDRIAQRINPILTEVLAGYRTGYYWSAYETEWASDVMFRSPALLAAIYPRLIRGAITAFDSRQVMRFLGKSLSNFHGESVSDYSRRVEGIRVKHSVDHNSVKAYDKAGSVLRVETTINDPEQFKVYRAPTGQPDGPKDWRKMRRGVTDLRRRAEVSQRANDRYYDALAALDASEPLSKLIAPVCRRTTLGKRAIRGLRPWADPDLALLRVVNRGQFAVCGFRNRDLRTALYPALTGDPTERRRASARITRALRLLRAHHLVKKIPRTHRYHLTDRGRQIVTALLQAQDVSIAKLTQIAA